MGEYLSYGGYAAATRDRARTLFGQTMWYVAITAGFFVVMIFVRVPHGSLVYAVLGLVIFAGLTMFDFQRLRRARDLESAPVIAASIFLDVLNVFLFFLRIFSRAS